LKYDNIQYMARNINLNRETWVVYNKTTSKIIIGDIPNTPIIPPKKAVDLLLYGSKEVISQSKNLVALIQRGSLEFSKKVGTEIDRIERIEGGEAVTSAEENELVNQVIIDEEITSSTKGVIAFGKDQDDTTQPIELTGPEGDELKIISIDTDKVLNNILDELIKVNIQMAFMTDTEIRNKEINLKTDL